MISEVRRSSPKGGQHPNVRWKWPEVRPGFRGFRLLGSRVQGFGGFFWVKLVFVRFGGSLRVFSEQVPKPRVIVELGGNRGEDLQATGLFSWLSCYSHTLG